MDLDELNQVTVRAVQKDPEDYCFVVRHIESPWLLAVKLVEVDESVDDDAFDPSSGGYDPSNFFGDRNGAGISTDPQQVHFDHTMINRRNVIEIDSPSVGGYGRDSNKMIYHKSTDGDLGPYQSCSGYFIESPTVQAGEKVAERMTGFENHHIH